MLDLHTRAGARGALAFAIVLAWSSPGHAEGAADRVATAQGLYDSAAELIRAGRFAEACPKLEESERLDPAMGTRFFLATCYESTGRPTKAWSLFLELASAAKADGNALREATARQRAASLEARLPRVIVSVADANAGLPGLTVLRDDTRLGPVTWGSPIPVDLGAHTVRATADGKDRVGDDRGRAGAGAANRGARAAAGGRGRPEGRRRRRAAGVARSRARSLRPAPGLGAQRIAALVVGSAGLAGLAAGGVLGLAGAVRLEPGGARRAPRTRRAARPRTTRASAP